MTTTAIELTFDRHAEERLSLLWRRLAALYEKTSESELGARPHLSLAVFRDAPPRNQSSIVDCLAKLAPFSLELSAVRVFPTNEGVVFFEPTDCDALHAAHRECTRILGGDAALVHPYYRKEKWVPHCTMAVGVPQDSLDEVAEHCREALPFGTIEVCRVSVVRYRPATELFSARLAGGQPSTTTVRVE